MSEPNLVDEWEECPLFAPVGAGIPQVASDTSNGSVSPAIGALSHLLYDEETPREIAEQLRDEGNRQFKRGIRGCRGAIQKYTEAISAAKGDPEAMVPALLNRSIAQYKLGNYGHSLNDAKSCLEVNPRDVKALYRAITCSVHLAKLDMGLRYCETALNLGNKLTAIEKSQFLQQKAIIKKKKQKSEERQEEKAIREASKTATNDKISDMLKKRKITVGQPLFGQQRGFSNIKPKFKDGQWEWPLLLIYPEEVISDTDTGDQSDYLEAVGEDTQIGEILNAVFEEAPRWDVRGLYRNPELLEARFRTNWTKTLNNDDEDVTVCGSALGRDEVGEWMTVERGETLAELISRPDYIMPLFPTLYIVPARARLR